MLLVSLCANLGEGQCGQGAADSPIFLMGTLSLSVEGVGESAVFPGPGIFHNGV